MNYIDNYISEKILQKQDDLIHSFLRTTAEPFDDWDWDGNELLIFLNDEVIERYSQSDLFEIIENFPLVIQS